VQPAADEFSRIFVGFGAGAEESLYNAYCSESTQPVVRISQVDVSTFGRVHRAKLGAVLRTLVRALRCATQVTQELPPSLDPHRLQFRTFAAMRIGDYSFARAWFEAVRDSSKGISDVCLLAADTAAFAATDAGLRITYFQHGFIRRSLLFPDFSRVRALTKDEGEYLQVRVPQATMCVAGSLVQAAELSQGEVLVASVYERPAEMCKVLPMLDWCSTQGYQVRVRPHPREDRSFWTDDVRHGQFELDDTDSDFLSALERIRPRVVVSWYSTALAEALDCGIVPVTVSDESTPAVRDMVYPLFSRTLRWPKDQERIAAIMSDDAEYRAVLRELREGLASDT